MVTIGNVRFEGKKSLKVRSCWFWWWEVVGLKVKVGGGGGQKSLGLVVGSVWVLKAFISQLHIWKAKGNKVSPAVTFNIKLSQGLISKRQGSKLPQLHLLPQDRIQLHPSSRLGLQSCSEP